MNAKEELVEILTIQIALDDKIHKIQQLQVRLRKRIDELRKEISGKGSDFPGSYFGL